MRRLADHQQRVLSMETMVTIQSHVSSKLLQQDITEHTALVLGLVQYRLNYCFLFFSEH